MILHIQLGTYIFPIKTRELFEHPDLAESIRFEAEILDHERVDLELQIPLTERIGVQEIAENGYQTVHFSEPPISFL